MLSILIPTYNYNIYPLVQELESQALKANIVFEIICIDDGSFSILNEENQKINALTNCQFIENKKNIGLSNNRNELAKKSQYENLLFIDGDSVIIDNQFVERYLKALTEDIDIVYGGRVHPESINDLNKQLRWKYGKLIEDKTAETRKKNIYKTLMFNNTLIKKSCFNLIKFDKTLIKYGHEDTLFAYQVALSKLQVNHIDNPVKHGDIDDSDTFLKKTENGLANLYYLFKSKKITSKFVKILKFYQLIRTLKLQSLLNYLFKKFEDKMKRQLTSSNPSLLIFKLYKIGYLCSLKNDL